jgi:hypothetical protein
MADDSVFMDQGKLILLEEGVSIDEHIDDEHRQYAVEEFQRQQEREREEIEIKRQQDEESEKNYQERRSSLHEWSRKILKDGKSPCCSDVTASPQQVALSYSSCNVDIHVIH